MDSLDSFRKLFEYDYWGTQEALQSIAAMKGSQERALKYAGHIIGAQQFWLARVETSSTPSGTPWPLLTLEEVRAAAEEQHRRWTALLDSLTPEKLEGDFVYRNSKGNEYRTLLRDLLIQLVVHGAYHRGQIAAAVRGAGEKPAATDYLVYTRKLAKG